MPVIIEGSTSSDLPLTLVERWRECPAAIAIDATDGAGRIDPAIRPLCPAGRQPRLFGRAVTARVTAPDFGAVLYAVDLVGPGDVLVIAAAGDPGTAMIGEILSGQLRRNGGCGVVCDGAVRDVATLAGWPDFSVFSRSVTPRGPVSISGGEVNGAVEIGGATVNPGDLIVGDDDGLVVLSPEAAREAIDRAEAKMRLEAQWEASLASGGTMASLFDLPPATKR